MDYNKEYEYYYDGYYSLVENRIKNYFIDCKAQKLNFGMSINDLRDFLDKGNPLKIKMQGFENLQKLYVIFRDRYSFYEEDAINLIFEKQITPEYETQTLSKLPTNYSLKKLIIDFTKLSAIKEITRILHNNSSLYEMNYRLNDFSDFEIREHRGISLENYPSHRRLSKILYPPVDNINPDSDIPFENIDYHKKNISLPFAVAMLKEIGFFELEKIKTLSDADLARIIAIIQGKDPNNKSHFRSIAGNVRVLNPKNRENIAKYTSYTHLEKAAEVLIKIKKGND